MTQEVSPLFLMASLVFLFHPEVFWNSVHAEPPVYWFFLALFFSFVRAGRPAAASAALGLLLGARHFSILLVPFHLAWLRRSGLSWKETAAQLMGAGALGLALVLPWLLPNPGPFLYGTLEWLAGYGAANRPAWAFQLGVQSWFYAAGRESLLAVIQPAVFSALFLATVAAIAAAARGRLGGLSEAPPRLLAWGGFAAAYLAFVCTGGMIWKSFLVSPFLAALAAAVLPAAAASPGGPGPGAAPRGILPRRPAAALLVLIMLLAASAGGGALVLRSARQWKDRGDVASLAAEAAPLLRQGDLVQDYGLLNAWHVYQGSAFTGIPVAPGVVISQAPRSQENMVFRRIVLFDGYSLLSPARDYPDIAGAYRLALARTKGRSRLSIYERPGPFTEKWRASADFDATAGVRFTSPSAPSIEGQRHGSVYLFGGLDPWIWTGTYPCQVAGVARPSIFAQLVEGKWLAVEVAPPAAGRLWLVTAVDDRALSMPFAPLVVAAGGSVRSAVVRHPPRKGIFSWPLGETDGGKATVSFQGAPGAPPNVCFDLVLSE